MDDLSGVPYHPSEFRTRCECLCNFEKWILVRVAKWGVHNTTTSQQWYQRKVDVFEVFKILKARVELESEKKIKCLRTYNGREYTGDEFDNFC